MRIAVDALGRDFSPRVTEEGAARLSEDCNLEGMQLGI
jgi:fatty acid/phospholipid biosynthesis enzyme